MDKSSEKIGYDKTIRAKTVAKNRAHVLLPLDIQVYVMMNAMPDKIFKIFWEVIYEIIMIFLDFKKNFLVI